MEGGSELEDGEIEVEDEAVGERVADGAETSYGKVKQGSSKRKRESGDTVDAEAAPEQVVVEADAETADQQPASTRAARRKAKKKKRKVEAAKGTVKDYFDVYGPKATAEVMVKLQSGEKLTLQDLQSLIVWIVGEGLNPQWVFIKNKPLICKTVLLLVGGLDYDLIMEHSAKMPFLTANCGQPLRTEAVSNTAPPSAPIGALLRLVRQRRTRLKDDTAATTQASTAQHGAQQSAPTSPGAVPAENGSARSPSPAGNGVAHEEAVSNDQEQKTSAPSEPPFPASYYVLSRDDMLANNYPLPPENNQPDTAACLPGYVTTRPALEPIAENRAMVGVDCEMCYTAQGLELTRCTLVDRDGEVLYDELVKPANPIKNYNTKFSGITAEMLADVTTTIEDVQRAFLDLVPAETILVGHSLESDLSQIKLHHANVIDTALLYSHPRGPPYKLGLRVLADRFLKRHIQGKGGHCSIEDAKAAIDLAKLKIQHGPAFGDSVERPGENLFEFLARHQRRCSYLDRPRMLHKFTSGSASAIVCKDDAEVASKTAKEVGKSDIDFVFARLAELSSHYEAVARSGKPTSIAAKEAARKTCKRRVSLDATLEKILRQLDGHIGAVHEALPTNTLFIVVSGHGDTPRVRQLLEMKWRKSIADPEWDSTREAALEAAIKRATTAVSYVSIKQ